MEEFSQLRSDIKIEFAMQSINQSPHVVLQNPALQPAAKGFHSHCQTVRSIGHQLSASDVLLWLLQLPINSHYRTYLQTTGILMGRVSWQSSKQLVDDPESKRSLTTSLMISIHLPIVRRALTLRSQRAIGMWTHTFQITRIVPDNSPIFRLVATEDESAIRRLFDAGLASPFDQTALGVTLLHVS
jgi:hypothetical protein